LQFSIFPAVSECCPCHPDSLSAFLKIASFVDQQHLVRVPRVDRREVLHVSTNQRVAPTFSLIRPYVSPAGSTIVQVFTGDEAKDLAPGFGQPKCASIVFISSLNSSDQYRAPTP
jgi:hypothetical protein